MPPPPSKEQLFTEAMHKAANRIDLVALKDAIHTCMFKDPNSYAETLKKMAAFFKELGMLKAALIQFIVRASKGKCWW